MAFITLSENMLIPMFSVKKRAPFLRIELAVAIYQIDSPDKEEEVDLWHNKLQILQRRMLNLCWVWHQDTAEVEWILKEAREMLLAPENSAKTIPLRKWTKLLFQLMIILHRTCLRVRKTWIGFTKRPITCSVRKRDKVSLLTQPNKTVILFITVEMMWGP